MRTKVLWSVCAVLFAAAVSAQNVKTVPAPVLSWYKDMIAMYTQLTRDLGTAKNATAAAKAFNDASKTVSTKKLAQRFGDLENQFPDFFSGETDTAWVPPADWVRLSADFAGAMQDYGMNIQNIMVYANDPTVLTAMQNFQMSLSAVETGE